MPRKRLSMRKIREVLRLKYYSNRSIREISGSCGIGRGTVGDYLNRAKAAGLSWPLPDELSDSALEQQLFPSSDTSPSILIPQKGNRGQVELPVILLLVFICQSASVDGQGKKQGRRYCYFVVALYRIAPGDIVNCRTTQTSNHHQQHKTVDRTIHPTHLIYQDTYLCQFSATISAIHSAIQSNRLYQMWPS